MSDLFQEQVPFKYVDDVMKIISATPQHRYQILTKRAERMAEYCHTRRIPTNAWLGVSVEDKEYGVPRIDVLRSINVKIRFLY
jgi:protein gp37